MPKAFRSDGAFVVVTDMETGVQTRISKLNVLVQKTSENSFFLKSDSFVAYYDFEDVYVPTVANLDALLDEITQWVTSHQSTVTVNNNTTNQMRVLSWLPHTTFGAFNATLSNASVMPQPGPGASVRATLDAVPSATVVLQSREYCIPDRGVTHVATLSGMLPAASNCVARVGMYDESNGLLFQCDSNGLSVVHRSPEEGDIAVQQLWWNLDPLDGTGASRFTLQTGLSNSFMLEWNTFNPTLPARAGIITRDGPLYCHAFSSNVGLLGSLPARWELASAGDNTPGEDASMVQGEAVVFTDTPVQNFYPQFGVASHPNQVQASTKGQAIALLALRVAPETCRRVAMRLETLDILNTADGGAAAFEIVLNAELPEDVEFSDVHPGRSMIQACSNLASASNGTVLHSGYLYGAGVTRVAPAPPSWVSCSSITGIPDTLTVRLTNTAGLVDASATATWSEKSS